MGGLWVSQVHYVAVQFLPLDPLETRGLEIIHPHLVPLDEVRAIEIHYIESDQESPAPTQTQAQLPNFRVELRPALVDVSNALVETVASEADGPSWIHQKDGLFFDFSLEQRNVRLPIHNDGRSGFLGTILRFLIFQDGILRFRKWIYIEGSLLFILRKYIPPLIGLLIGSNVLGLLFTSWRHHQEIRQHLARDRFQGLRQKLRHSIPGNFAAQVKQLRPYQGLLDEWICLERLQKVYEYWRTVSSEDQFKPTDKETFIVDNCSLAWVEALLVLWDHMWSKEELKGTKIAPYRPLLRLIPRERLSAEAAQRVRSLLERANAGATRASHQWPPLADQPCAHHLHAYPRPASSQSSVFPEPGLDAQKPKAQIWLFRAEKPLFWPGHPLFQKWRHPRAVQEASPRTHVVVIRGKPGSGRTALALALGRYSHPSTHFGVYVSRPRRLQDLQRAFARRLMVFVCNRASDLWRLTASERLLLQHLWQSVWPLSTVRLYLERAYQAWLLSPTDDSEEHLVRQIARLELRQWVHQMESQEFRPPLTTEAWWAGLAEILPALRRAMPGGADQPWQAVYLVLDDAAALTPKKFENWHQKLEPVTEHSPIVWFFLVRTDRDPPSISPSREVMVYEEVLTWSAHDLREMLRWRLQHIYGERDWHRHLPPQEHFEELVTQARGNPRALGELWNLWEKEVRTPDNTQGHLAQPTRKDKNKS